MEWNAVPIGSSRLLLIVLAVVLVALLLLLRRRRRRPLPYTRRAAVLEPMERELQIALQDAVGSGVQVWPRVHAADALDVRRSASRRRRRAALARIADQRFEFLLCAASDSRPLAAIRLERDERKSAATLLAAVCEAAGLPMIVLSPEARHDIDDLRESIRPYLEEPASVVEATGERREPIIDLPPD